MHGTKQQLAKLQQVDFEIEGVAIIPQPQVRNLGVIFDPSLDMKAHVTALCKRAYFELHNINCLRDSLTKQAATAAIHAFVTSRLDHHNALLYGLPNNTINKVQNVQNSAARTLTGGRRRDHITPVFKKLHWLKIRPRIEYKILIITYKCLFGNGPEYLRELLTFHRPERNLRSSSDSRMLVDPQTRLSTAGDRSYYKAAPYLWNKLPHNVRHAQTLGQFKQRLKSFLYQREYGPK